jgi:hypothetical protein
MSPRALLRSGAIALAVALLVLFVPALARAQGPAPELHFHADADVVALGDSFHVTLQAMSSSSMPSDPQPGATAGFAVTGMSPSTSTQMSFVNGTVSSQRGLTTVWTLRATKLGTFTLGPPTVRVDGTRYSGQALSVRVVPAGQAPQRAQPQQQNPFDPFGGLFGQLPQIQFPGFDAPQQRQAFPSVDPRYALDSARGPLAFLHATIDRPSAVVGEQVTYTVLIYIDTQVGHDLDLADPHEVPADDFVKRSLQADDTKLTALGYAEVGGKVYAVQLLRKLALFPLKTGDLDIGEMTVQLTQGGTNGVRRSEDLHVHVSEPPVQGRPPGYEIGDVGQLTLAAEVSGRDIEQDGAIGVTVTLSGNGNLPASIYPPEHAGVEWLDPQVGEKVGAQRGGDRFGGTRTFQYVVRLHRAGEIDLGDFTLPYWEPQNRIYQVARAPLGTIHVRPSATPSAPAEAANDPLPGLPAARPLREKAGHARRHFDDAPSFWLGLGAMPFAYAVVVAAAGTAKRIRRTRSERALSPEADLRARVRVAEEASSKGDPRALDAATARALEAATIAGCKLNVRGLTTSAVGQALREAGAADGDASEVESILRDCDAARFSAAGAGDDAEANHARERWERARQAIERLTGLAWRT